ncbi:MAG: hypothetical protein V7724_00585 [Sediminicola sp.]
MKIFIYLLLLVAVVAAGSCDNQEGDDAIEIIAPNDSTEAAVVQYQKKMPL